MAERRHDDLIARDARRTWHPYTQHGSDPEPLPVVAAEGAWLVLADGRRVLDAISSWWTCLHGHGEPRLVAAMRRQAATLDHVLFAGATHPAAVALAEALVELAPPGLARVFYSDDGSTAVEVALKLVVQAHAQAGAPERRVFVALEHGYHGDTFGAMAVGDPEPFFRAFAPLLFEVRRVPVDEDATAVAAALAELGPRAAGVVVEPLVQGAGGMRMHGPGFLRGARAACDAAGVPLVADEVMTGFGRTGAWFACERADVTPDVLCLAKGLTGGMVPLAATLVAEPWFARFVAEDRARMLFHGHSFTAWPIGCAVALESLALAREREVPARLDALGARIHAALVEALPSYAPVRDLRRTGGIVAVDVVPDGDAGYLAEVAPRLRRRALERGLLLRPLGNVLYAMPPACLTDAEADRLGTDMAGLVMSP
ncbi:MAG: adenosylmethionine--8-amino-7-oxononanoate transaminase [Planctomycetota bacterium]